MLNLNENKYCCVYFFIIKLDPYVTPKYELYILDKTT